MKTEGNEVLALIRRIRESFEGAEEVYKNGSCVQFCLILQEVYPSGQIMYDQNHAIFQLNDRCYDITGEVVKSENYMPLKDFSLGFISDAFKLKYSIQSCLNSP